MHGIGHHLLLLGSLRAHWSSALLRKTHEMEFLSRITLDKGKCKVVYSMQTCSEVLDRKEWLAHVQVNILHGYEHHQKV
jgi:hypothetical protein